MVLVAALAVGDGDGPPAARTPASAPVVGQRHAFVLRHDLFAGQELTNGRRRHAWTVSQLVAPWDCKSPSCQSAWVPTSCLQSWRLGAIGNEAPIRTAPRQQ